MQTEACTRGMVICKGCGVIKMFKTCQDFVIGDGGCGGGDNLMAFFDQYV